MTFLENRGTLFPIMRWKNKLGSGCAICTMSGRRARDKKAPVKAFHSEPIGDSLCKTRACATGVP